MINTYFIEVESNGYKLFQGINALGDVFMLLCILLLLGFFFCFFFLIYVEGKPLAFFKYGRFQSFRLLVFLGQEEFTATGRAELQFVACRREDLYIT